MIRTKVDIIEKLREAGYSTYRLRKEKIVSEGALQAFRNGRIPSFDRLNRLCELLNCQPGDLIEYVGDDIE